MTEKQLSQFLTTKGFEPNQVRGLISELMNIDDALKPSLEKWVNNDELQDVSANGYTVFGFMNDFKMKYPAALLSLDWVLKEPEKAIPIIKKGIR